MKTPVNSRYGTYFANETGDELAAQLRKKVERLRESTTLKRILDEQRNAYLQVHSISMDGMSSSSMVARDGQQGELATFRVPMAKALGSAVVNLVTNAQVAWQAMAVNDDAEARAQAILGNNTLEYFWSDRGVQQVMTGQAEGAVYFGERFVLVEYDETAGENVSAATMPSDPLAGGANELLAAAGPEALEQLGVVPTAAAPQREGDIRYHLIDSWDLLRDPAAKSFEKSPFILFKVQRNRFDLIAQYGEEVISQCDERDPHDPLLSPVPDDYADSDLRDVWYFFHDRTPACPRGRQAILYGNKVLAESDLKYREVPVVRLATGNLTGTPFPIAPFWSALAAQEVKDAVLSAVATNNMTLGHQMIAAPMGTDMDPTAIGPMQMVFYPQGSEPPAPLQLTRSSPEAMSLLQMLESSQKQLLGLNNTALGQPEGSNLSGAAMALLSSMALQANSSFQGDFKAAVEKVGNITLHIIQDFFTTDHKIQIGGKSTAYMSQEAAFSGPRLRRVNSVRVTIGNPAAQTVAGRSAIADKYIQLQMALPNLQLIKTPEDLEQLLSTGRIEGLTDYAQNQALLIKAEQEALSRGEKVTALLGDDDRRHVAHHIAELCSPSVRKNQDIVRNYWDHVAGHYTNCYGVPPEQPAVDPVTGQPVIDPVTGQPQMIRDPLYRSRMLQLCGLFDGAPPMMAPPPGAPPPEQGPPAEKPPGPQPGSEMPSLPTNPATGQQYDSATGGGVVAPQ